MSMDPLNPDGGEPAALDSRVGYAVHYTELVRIARAELARHQRQGTLDTRALVHEAWLKLHPGEPQDFANRRHFYATAAIAMRHVVIDYARARQAQRRGNGMHPVTLEHLDSQPVALDQQIEHLVQLDAALQRLAELDPRLVQIVELRFFSGLEVTEVAELLGVSEPTIKRGTRLARAFLQKSLSSD
ncbi:MAG: RNA polymerase sigma factor SigX [Alphaproteobacteria bacterium ADurb.BinA280]|jgi:RNA polymerase sigma factor (TIGR02999 family)|nr:sigma-70 family RNA polymerase sigma factor [Xanthomonadales bacterium]MCC6506639.1 sigma-70 family RNA polymerase sigma factor [Aquimonas sp.]OPZ12215.1 MAG: RNA polymerase sigma factor SigX [Alphaproteobacteria bacterium ADurb.BinA280]